MQFNPSWSSHRNSVHEAVENLHSVFAFPWRDHDSSSFLNFSYISSPPSLFFFISKDDNFIFPFKPFKSQTLTIEFNLLLIPPTKIFITSIVLRLLIVSQISVEKTLKKNASTHRFSITLSLPRAVRISTYIPIYPIIIIFTFFSLAANFANLTLVQITEKNIENLFGRERANVPEDRSLRHRRRTPTERKACNRCIVLLGIWAWHRGRWVRISLRLRAVHLIASERKKKKKKDAIANMLFNVLLNVSLYMPSFRFESLFKNRYKNILFTDKKDKYLGY